MEYKEMRIHELRDYARGVGVRKPTTYDKSTLIEKIYQVERGEVEPFFTKKGRGKRNLEGKKLLNTEKEEKREGREKEFLLFVISKAKKFLEELEKEIL